MKASLIGLSLACFLVSVPSSATVHSITYSKNAQEPPRLVTLGGQQFALVRFAVRDFSVDQRYLVSYMAPMYDLDGDPATTDDLYLAPTSLVTEHTDEVLNSNITIDGYPGDLEFVDGRSYNMQGDFFTTNKQFSVDHTSIVQLRVKVGGMVLSFFSVWNRLQQPVAGGDQDPTPPYKGYVDLGDSYNAYPAVRWGLYVDPAGLVGAADAWIDYITIQPLP